MTITAAPAGPEIEQDRDLEQRVADLEALIEEARRRARRRRQRNAGAALLLAAAGAAAFIGFGGHGGGGADTAATAHARSSSGSVARLGLASAVVAPPRCADVSTSEVDSGGRAGRTFWVAVPPIWTDGTPPTFFRFCGPATVNVRAWGRSFQIRSGYCNASRLNYWQYQLHVGLEGHVAAAPAKFLEFFVRYPRAVHGRTFPAAASMQLGGRTLASRGETWATEPAGGTSSGAITRATVTIAKSQRAGTFAFHLRDAARITGSWTCGEKPYNDH